MDVRCNRCGTEYEFDDALISDRGTTVKCTNCGLQFKVFPSHLGGGPERWVVKTGAGRELVFTSLRELQRGIAERKVEPGDMLTRGQKPPRPLSSIAELEPFFQSSLGKAGGDRAPRTLHGVAPPANSVAASATAATLESPFAEVLEVPEPPHSPRLQAEAPLMVGLAVTAPSGPTMPAIDDAPVVHQTPPAPQSSPISSDSAPTARRTNERSAEGGHWPDLTPLGALPSSPRVPFETVPRSSPLSSPRAALESSPRSSPISSPRGALDSTPRPPLSSPRGSFHSYDEFASPAGDRVLDARRARSRWIVGVVAIGMAGLVAATVGRRYLVGVSVPTASPVASSDARVGDFLKRGNQFADEGDYEAAQDELVKASLLADKDPRVLGALARLETLRADVFWLKLRLLDPVSTELVSATHRELGRRVGRARQAVDRAFAAAPEEPMVMRARIDALRLSGENDKAREWTAPISSNASDPENAFVLAALDLSDAAPVWASVIDRLRTASAGEREPGRARAALIYALARAERLSEAKAELGKLEAQSKPHVLLDELRGFLARFAGVKDGGASAEPATLAVDPSKLPTLDTSTTAEERPGQAVPSDFRAALSQAALAVRSGELGRADTLYRAALADQPGNVEALSGLGDIARRQGDSARAAQLYDQVLAQNPSYLPAMSASADQKWASGNRAGAVVLYRRIVEQVGTGSDYGARAQARLSEAAASPALPSSAAPSPTSTPPAHAPTEPKAVEVDTTDLPGAR